MLKASLLFVHERDLGMLRRNSARRMLEHTLPKMSAIERYRKRRLQWEQTQDADE